MVEMTLRYQTSIAESVQQCLINPKKPPPFLARIPAYLNTYSLLFECLREDLFDTLKHTWNIEQHEYVKSFTGKDALVPMGNMGYSGSTFFHTRDGAYLIKSIPRHFEHSFFRDDMLLPYANHMQANLTSLLVRITDFLQCVQQSLGSIFGFAPSHHIVMENITYGTSEDRRRNKDGESTWQNWDLKPMSYFYPERDIAGGALSSEATKSKLADDFKEKIVLDLDSAEAFKAQLEKDTKLLADCNAVDYSLFLVRIPSKHTKPRVPADSVAPPHSPPFVPPEPPNWRTGIPSADGKYFYRASILDFFWAKHKVHAKAMTGLIMAYNFFDTQGPMSVTTTSAEYRERFLTMCRDIIEIKEIEVK